MSFGQVGRKSFVEDPEAFAADAATLRARRGELTVISERCDVVQMWCKRWSSVRLRDRDPERDRDTNQVE